MQADSSKRRRVAVGIYTKNGVYIAGFSDPNTGRWVMPTLKATTLTAAKRERASMLSALGEGRAAFESSTAYDSNRVDQSGTPPARRLTPLLWITLPRAD